MKPLAVLLMALVMALAVAVPWGPAAAQGVGTPGIDALTWKRRVILVSAPAADDPRLLRQRRILATWRQEAEDRDVTAIELLGAVVQGVGVGVGVGDGADGLRERFGLPPGRFGVVLIGKDGRVALRSAEPVTGADLVQTIDAMPMRRAGQR